MIFGAAAAAGGIGAIGLIIIIVLSSYDYRLLATGHECRFRTRNKPVSRLVSDWMGYCPCYGREVKDTSGCSCNLAHASYGLLQVWNWLDSRSAVLLECSISASYVQ